MRPRPTGGTNRRHIWHARHTESTSRGVARAPTRGQAPGSVPLRSSSARLQAARWLDAEPHTSWDPAALRTAELRRAYGFRRRAPARPRATGHSATADPNGAANVIATRLSPSGAER